MTTHGHKHPHEKKSSQPSHRKIDWSALHKDWRAWLVIGIMLLAIGTYILTLDESVQPGGASRSGNPTGTAPTSPAK
jgi:hypothetical protein